MTPEEQQKVMEALLSNPQLLQQLTNSGIEEEPPKKRLQFQRLNQVFGMKSTKSNAK